ncbi:MAG: cell adhesion protein, partial [Clostridiales Family XIII bacterium]|nr:cell adhesion protein [Clostridiales Family XIII bacterium]
NTGKAQLRNLRVTAEGNFDAVEATSYYAGNMASGANDRYSFSFIPREEGTLNGKILFTYDDPAGDEQTTEKAFSYEVRTQMQEDPGLFPQEAQEAPKSRMPLYIGGGAVLVLAALLFLRRTLKRRRMRLETEIDDEQL